MKIIFQIAKRELSTQFYSPIAWLLLVIFTVQCGIHFTSLLDFIEVRQSLGRESHFLTDYIFSNIQSGFFTYIKSNLYLYIPLLTMGLMSREFSSGSIKLLFSSPIKTYEIVLGKFVAMMFYGLILVAILLLFAVYGFVVVESLDLGLILSGLLGLYLLICTYSAVGLYMSSLTQYQVVAVISTFAALFLLNFIGTVWQHLDFVRDITYWLSIAGRADQLIGGLIISKDFLYFIIVMFLFLGLSVLKLQSGRESWNGLEKAKRYGLIVVAALFIGYFSSRPMLTFYLDISRGDTRTLTKESQRVMKSFDGPLSITTYVNVLDKNFFYGRPIMVNYNLKLFERYYRFKPDITTKYVYYYDQAPKETRLYRDNPGLSNLELAKKVLVTAKLDFDRILSPDSIRSIIDLTPEENRFVRVLEYKGRKSYLRMFDDNYRHPNEKEITAAFKRLITGGVKVGFLEGHHERSLQRLGDEDYKLVTTEVTFRDALINQGFDVVPVSLKGKMVPMDISTLVIADPKENLNIDELIRIDEYIQRGGNLVVLGEPNRSSILNPLISTFGVKFSDGILLQESEDFEPDFVLADSEKLIDGIDRHYKDMFEEDFKVSLPTASAIEIGRTTAWERQVLLTANSKTTRNVTGDVNLDFADSLFLPQYKSDNRDYPVAVALKRRIKDGFQRVVIIGDADFMSNGEISRRKIDASNLQFTLEVFKWLSKGEFPVDTTRPESIDNLLKVKRKGLMAGQITFTTVIPVFILLFGSVLLIRRRRK